MKRVLLASIAIFALAGTPAVGADIPYKAPGPAVAPAPYWSWTGFYIGGHLGGGWAQKEWVDVPSGGEFIGSSNLTGFLGGLQLGFNYQFNNWLVFGVEGDWSWTNLDGRFNCFATAPVGGGPVVSDTCLSKVDWFGTATGRLGAVVGSSLVYTKFGAAWTRDGFSQSDNIAFLAQTKVTKTGWTWGAGVEYPFSPNWSGKIEYDYMDFGTIGATLVPNIAVGPTVENIRQRVHVVKVGLNYRFDLWGVGPVHARY